MIEQPKIKVGLITDGIPQITIDNGMPCINNLLIGAGFHWQRTIPIHVKGTLQILPEAQGNIHCINILDLEDYICSVIGSEMNPQACTELRKAHAIISRSWALRKIMQKTPKRIKESACNGTISWEESDCHDGFDVCSDDHCQRYQGFESEGTNLCRGMVLTDSGGNIVDTRFSKCCGGQTEIFSSCWDDKDYDYLPSIADPWCDLSDMQVEEREKFLSRNLKTYDYGDDYREWETTVDSNGIARRLQERYNVNIGKIEGLRAKERGASGRITKLEIKGTEGSISIGKTLSIRRLLAADCLRSSWFDISRTATGFRLNGRGWGHGVGLCQIGAARMAWEGKDHRAILKFYYPHTEITQIYE